MVVRPQHRRLLAIYVGSVVAGVLLLVALFLALERMTVPETPTRTEDGTGVAKTLPEAVALPPSKPPVPGALLQVVEPSTIGANDLPPYKEVVEDRALVRLLQPQRQLAAGDRPAIPIPQLGLTYHAFVERVEVGPGSTRSVAGYASSVDGSRHLFVYTIGPRSTFARIGTLHGTFELVADGELGWLMPTANMDQHVDYNKPDTFIVRPNGADRPSDVTL